MTSNYACLSFKCSAYYYIFKNMMKLYTHPFHSVMYHYRSLCKIEPSHSQQEFIREDMTVSIVIIVKGIWHIDICYHSISWSACKQTSQITIPSIPDYNKVIYMYKYPWRIWRMFMPTKKHYSLYKLLSFKFKTLFHKVENWVSVIKMKRTNSEIYKEDSLIWFISHILSVHILLTFTICTLLYKQESYTDLDRSPDNQINIY